MTLDEHLESTLNNADIEKELKAAAYGNDNRPAWVGAYRPSTECEELKRMASWAATHYSFYLNFVRDFMERRGKVLDIGSGAGQNTAMLARYAEKALGVEPESYGHSFAVKYNRDSGAEFISRIFPHPDVLELGPFDYIFCIETIEHVMYEQQIDLLQAALDMLTPNGRVFITTPDESSAGGPHHGIWTPEWVPKLLDKFGGRIVKRGHFQNTRADEGFVETGTHHAWVLG